MTKTPDINSERIRVAVIDDDAAAVKILCKALKSYPEVAVCATATDLVTARRLIEDERPDLVFLDIEFPDADRSGLDLMNRDSILAPETEVVFYTSYSRYLIQALRMQAFDFLLKPFDEEELRIIMNRYRLQRRNGSRREAGGASLPLPSRQVNESKPLAITTVTNDKVIVPPSEIIFFKYDSERKVWEVVLSNLQRHILKRHTTAEAILNYGPDFIRTHKTYIVNVAYLGMITSQNCTLLPPYDNITEIKISKAYRRSLLDRFYDL
jgi:two-component system LytT family response regulator